MKLFYAYLKHVCDCQPGSQSHNTVARANDDVTYRYLITFVNCEAADDWWRMTSTSPSPFAGNVKRISSQFYTHNVHKINLANTFFSRRDLPDSKEFLEKMFFTQLADKDARVIPPTEVTDHISGRWYFVRSKADPRKHWYFRISGVCLVCGDAKCDAIHVSTEYSTRFCVHLRATGSQVSDIIMIGKDEISIAASKDYMLRINDGEELKADLGYPSGPGADLLFSDLKNRFISRVENQENGSAWECVVLAERGLGMAWELVD